MTHTRQQLLDALAQLGEEHPEMRFGQLVAFVGMLARGPEKGTVYDVTDEELLRAAQEHIRKRADARVATPVR